MKTKPRSETLRAQAQEMQQIWQELMSLLGQLRAAMPADLARAKTRLGAHESETGRGVGEYHLDAFFASLPFSSGTTAR